MRHDPTNLTRVSAPAFLTLIDESTGRRLRLSCQSPADDHFPSSVFLKIRETLIDLQFLAAHLEIKPAALVDYFCIFRSLNSFVYGLDGLVESPQRDTSNYREISKVLADKYLRLIDAVVDTGPHYEEIKTWTADHGEYVLKEFDAVKALRNTEGYQSTYFRDLFEECDKQHIDTGFYGKLLLKQFGPHDVEAALAIWNTRSKILDVVDGLIDLNQDISEGTPCPLILYVYSVGTAAEREMLSSTFISHKHESEFLTLINNYSERLLGIYKSCLLDSSDSISAMLLARTRKLIEITQESLGHSNLSDDISSFYMNQDIPVYDFSGLTDL